MSPHRRSPAFGALSPGERRAFRRRFVLFRRRRPSSSSSSSTKWRAWVEASSLTDPDVVKDAVSLRDKIVKVIKNATTEYFRQTTTNSNESYNDDVRRRRCISGSSGSHHPSSPRVVSFSVPSKAAERAAGRRPSTMRSAPSDCTDRGDSCALFVLDLGSTAPTSNADLTLLDASSMRVVDYVLRQVNKVFSAQLGGVEFDETLLNRVFDVTLFVNSFVMTSSSSSSSDRLSYIDLRGDRQCVLRQRAHAKSRAVLQLGLLPTRTNPGARCEQQQQAEDDKLAESARKSLDSLLRRKHDDLRRCRLCDAVEATSRMTYVAPYDEEAYHSQGAFLHVVLEMQAGATYIPISADEYLDSAFDNLGMLMQAWDVCSGELSSKDVSKYTGRLAHALRRWSDEVAASNTISPLVAFLDQFPNAHAHASNSPASTTRTPRLLRHRRQRLGRALFVALERLENYRKTTW